MTDCGRHLYLQKTKAILIPVKTSLHNYNGLWVLILQSHNFTGDSRQYLEKEGGEVTNHIKMSHFSYIGPTIINSPSLPWEGFQTPVRGLEDRIPEEKK